MGASHSRSFSPKDLRSERLFELYLASNGWSPEAGVWDGRICRISKRAATKTARKATARYICVLTSLG